MKTANIGYNPLFDIDPIGDGTSTLEGWRARAVRAELELLSVINMIRMKTLGSFETRTVINDAQTEAQRWRYRYEFDICHVYEQGMMDGLRSRKTKER